MYEVYGSSGFAVFGGDRWNKMIHWGLTIAKAADKDCPVGQERKCEDRRWLETVVFHALNDTISVAGY